MFTSSKKIYLIRSPAHLAAFIIVAIVFIMIQNIVQKREINSAAFHITLLDLRTRQSNTEQYSNRSTTSLNVTRSTPAALSLAQVNHLSRFDNNVISLTDSLLLRVNGSLETTVKCVGPFYNQSCLYKNMYYVDSTFWVLTVKGKHLPPLAVRIDAFNRAKLEPRRRDFDSYAQLEQYIREVIDPMVVPDLTVYFGQPWHFNIGHALFDGLYSAYVALIRFSPRHLRPFRLLVSLYSCDSCWSEDVYSRFAGLGIIKQSILDSMSVGRWFLFDGLIMGSGMMCQRCTQPSLQLPGGVELNGSRLFRDRMYKQHGLIPPVVRQKHSAEGRSPKNPLIAYVIDNKRYTTHDRKEIEAAIDEINTYTNKYLTRTDDATKLQWPLIRVSYLHYNLIKSRNLSSPHFNASSVDSRLPAYELMENDFMAQLRIMRKMDIHITASGTGQMYQTFLSDGSVSINLGGLRPWGMENSVKAYASFLEQHMTAGTPYIKGLYYPVNERPKGIQKDEVIKLIRKAAELILNGFSLPVNPRENLAPDGQLFREMCEKDKLFCRAVTDRLGNGNGHCIDTWSEDIVHEQYQWKRGGFIDVSQNLPCPLNRTLLHELRQKYGIKHYANLIEKWVDQLVSLFRWIHNILKFTSNRI